MSLDVKKDVIFNTFNGLEEQLSDPDPVKEVRNYRWALRQQTILFQNFLNEMRLEQDAIKQKLEEKYEEENDKRNEILEELKASVESLQKEIDNLEETHRAEIMYQSSLTGQKLREQEEALRKELLPQAEVMVKQVRDIVRQEELAGVEKHLRELFVLAQQRSLDLGELSTKLRGVADELDTTSSDFASFLREAGGKEFTVKVGTIFNPARHEIVATISDGESPYNTITEVHANGFALGRKPIVRAQVTVNTSPKDLKDIVEQIRVSEEKVRDEIKELIEVYESEGDIEALRAKQKSEREYEIGEEVAPYEGEYEEEYEEMIESSEEEYEEYEEGEEEYEEEVPKKLSWRERRRAKKEARQRELEEARAAEEEYEEEYEEGEEEYEEEDFDTEDFDTEDFDDTTDFE